MSEFYYVALLSNEKFIKKIGQYAVRSLLKTGVSKDDCYIVANTKQDYKLIKKLITEFKVDNIYICNVDLSNINWKYAKGKRIYSYFKFAALKKFFPKPKKDKYMVFYDGDVLFYKDPTEFLRTKCEKTWFHHGKDLITRSPAGRSGKTHKDIDPSDYSSISTWCSKPQAWLMAKWGAKIVPEYEVVSGFYILHPKDHEKIIEWTFKGCSENTKKFRKHEGVGDQKPMNAALAYLEVDWHGGSRFFCPEHKAYFDHFFGKDNMKEEFWGRAKKMGLR